MAGDWLKMRTRLAEERAVLLICELTGLDQFAVVGRLHAFWSWAGEHTVTGKITDVTLKTVDRVTAHSGFGAAMVSAKWLEAIPDGGINVPRWNEHNGKAAKSRHLASLRQVRKRRKMSRATSRSERDVTVTNHATRVEKSREDSNKPRKPLKPHAPPQRNGSGTVRDLDSVEANEGKARQALSLIKTKHLRDTELLVKFHETLVGLEVWGMHSSEASVLRLLGTAERSLRGENPGGMFNALVRGGCKVLDPGDEDAASRRWRKYQSGQPSGP